MDLWREEVRQSCDAKQSPTEHDFGSALQENSGDSAGHPLELSSPGARELQCWYSSTHHLQTLLRHFALYADRQSGLQLPRGSPPREWWRDTGAVGSGNMLGVRGLEMVKFSWGMWAEPWQWLLQNPNMWWSVKISWHGLPVGFICHLCICWTKSKSRV